MRIKNWEKFQHYKDPNKGIAWIKLYLNVLDRRDVYILSDRTFRILIGLWLLAAEKGGDLPGIDDIVFRLRFPKPVIEKAIEELREFVLTDSRVTLEKTESLSSTEKRREEKRREEYCLTDIEKKFNQTWIKYPRKDGKTEALKYFKRDIKTEEDFHQIQKALGIFLLTLKTRPREPRYIPTGKTWFNNWRDWLDDPENVLQEAIDERKRKEFNESLFRGSDSPQADSVPERGLPDFLKENDNYPKALSEQVQPDGSESSQDIRIDH